MTKHDRMNDVHAEFSGEILAIKMKLPKPHSQYFSEKYDVSNQHFNAREMRIFLSSHRMMMIHCDLKLTVFVGNKLPFTFLLVSLLATFNSPVMGNKIE